jgi:hypothetical protein
MNGYAMALNIPKMKQCQFDADARHLFDPKFINVGNEDDLCKRMIPRGGRMGVHTRAFVFHFKGFTVMSQVNKSRDMLDGYPVLDHVH